MGKYEDKKKWLNRYQEAKTDLETLQEQYDELVESQESTGAINYYATSGASGENSDLSRYMAQRESIAEKIIKKRYRKLQIGIEITNAINGVSNKDERALLTKRYLLGKKWQDICDEMNMSWNAVVNKLHSRALEHLVIPKQPREQKKGRKNRQTSSGVMVS